MSMIDAQIGTLRLQLTVNAPVKTVWRSLTKQIDEWWPDEFYAGGTKGTRKFTLEAVPGGRMFEKWKGGGGVLWGTVVTADPGKLLQVNGHLFPNWGGPSNWYGTWELAANDKQTELVFTESGVGLVTEIGLREKEDGWKILCDALTAHAETAKK